MHFKRLSETLHSDTQFPPTILPPWKLFPGKLSPVPIFHDPVLPSLPVIRLCSMQDAFWTPESKSSSGGHPHTTSPRAAPGTQLALNGRREKPTSCEARSLETRQLWRWGTHAGRGGAHSPAGLRTALCCPLAARMNSGKGLSAPQRSRSDKEAERKRKKS